MLTDRDAPSFDVHLENFSGPFDLLLGLISRRRLEITEVALAAVTDEFIAHLRRMLAAVDAAEAAEDPDGDGDGASGARATAKAEVAALGQASGFLVVAATLLDLKVARLLPTDETDELDAEGLALVEARDLLFARLLQHRAYAQVAALLADRLAEGALRTPRPGGTGAADPLVERALPELVLATTPDQLAALAAAAIAAPVKGRRGLPARVDVEHLHAPTVSVPEQVALLRTRLVARFAERGAEAVSFAELIADAGEGSAGDGRAAVVLVVGRFLAVLELYRRGELDLDQTDPAQPLQVRWRGVVDLTAQPDETDPPGEPS
ncbi:segregation/condensation protein A [Quadrisphaera setariae]|uniref:Segregation and condensation protein A n=1 Tax=Quadrisphaera setariae TaxID=2593304 RepID=A0A5C8ZJ41_9ACTN|nr:segregation/condensation protein A [Quadrisphaera setariae]